jgi:hypothetical protein
LQEGGFRKSDASNSGLPQQQANSSFEFTSLKHFGKSGNADFVVFLRNWIFGFYEYSVSCFDPKMTTEFNHEKRTNW